jgi:hypothetical protein
MPVTQGRAKQTPILRAAKFLHSSTTRLAPFYAAEEFPFSSARNMRLKDRSTDIYFTQTEEHKQIDPSN